MKKHQEVTLAIRLRRDDFGEILRLAVHSSFAPEVYASQGDWKREVSGSDVRLQWDPDHGPSGNPVERRAIQLGLRGEILAKYVNEFLPNIQVMSRRLPRIMTDQTTTIGVARTQDALDVMLPIVYEVQQIARP